MKCLMQTSCADCGRHLRSERKWVATHLNRLDLSYYFECIKCAEDVQFTKPYPDLYEAVCSALDLRPVQAIAFEDTLNGVLAAKRAGLYCVAIPNPITRHLPMLEADMVVSSLLDVKLEELIEKVENRSWIDIDRDSIHLTIPL